MNCGSECIKYLLFIFNFVFALGGLALLVLGVVIHMGLSGIVKLNVDVHISVPASLMIAVGAIIFIIAFFGCCGAIRESHCMIVTFAIMLLTLLVVQVAVAIWGFMTMDEDQIKKNIDQGIRDSVEKYFIDPAIAAGVDSIQTFASCCGYNGYDDYKNSQNNVNKDIPYSCCNNSEGQYCTEDKAKGRAGCSKALFPLIKKYANVLGYLAIGIAVVELVGIIFSFCLANSIRNVERRGYKV